MHDKITALRAVGMTLQAIGKLLGISRQRVHQILNPEYRKAAKRRYYEQHPEKKVEQNRRYKRKVKSQKSNTPKN